MKLRLPLAASGLLLSSPAGAHPGGHSHMSLMELAAHYAEPDHLAFLALCFIVGVISYRWGRRVAAKAALRRAGRKQDRP